MLFSWVAEGQAWVVEGQARECRAKCASKEKASYCKTLDSWTKYYANDKDYQCHGCIWRYDQCEPIISVQIRKYQKVLKCRKWKGSACAEWIESLEEALENPTSENKE